MDSLDDLPIDENSNLSVKDKELLKRYFGEIDEESVFSHKIKILIISIVSFLILSNPIVKRIIRCMPFIGGGEFKYTIISATIFSIVMLISIYGDEYLF